MRKYFALIMACTGPLMLPAQQDSAAMAGIFERISRELHVFTVDTSAVPDDKFSRKLNELKALKGVFNIYEAIEFKLQEEEKENKKPKATIGMLRNEFTSGRGKKWLDNAVYHIYRQHFSYRELKQLVKFYKTSAGRKLAGDFPFLMMKSMMAGQFIHDLLLKEAETPGTLSTPR